MSLFRMNNSASSVLFHQEKRRRVCTGIEMSPGMETVWRPPMVIIKQLNNSINNGWEGEMPLVMLFLHF